MAKQQVTENVAAMVNIIDKSNAKGEGLSFSLCKNIFICPVSQLILVK